MKKIIVISVFFALVTIQAQSQDIHLSQYDACPVILNPALTGLNSNMKYRIVNQYRNQWDALARKSFVSTAVAYDMPFKQKWGLGGYLLNDNSSRLFNSFNFVLSGSHDIAMGNQDKHHLMVGLQVGIISKKMRVAEYTYDSQYTSGFFDADLPSNEIFERETRIMPEINFGFAYVNTDENLKYRPYGGIAISHVTNPKESFLAEGTDSKLPLKYLLNGGCKMELKEGFILDPSLMFMRQRNINEFNIGLRSYNDIKGADFTIISGVFYRVQDAVVTHVGIYYRNFVYRVSYDINVSPLKQFSNYKGGLEFSITFFKTIAKGGSSFSGS